MREKFADPAYRVRHQENAQKAIKQMSAKERKRRQAHGRALGRSTGARHLGPAGSPIRVAVGRKITERYLGWCPAPYRAAYLELRLTKRVLAPAAKAMILEQIERDRRARAAHRLTFDEQLARVAAGVQLVTRPDLRRPAPDFTVGGIATAAIS